MRTDAQKKTMIAAIMREFERLPFKGEDGSMHSNRAYTLVGIINGIISEDRVEELENDDQLSDRDAETCHNAFRWLAGDDDARLVDDEDLLAVSPSADDTAAPAPKAVDEETAVNGISE